ncbi:peroxisomal N(1)-acetyl-spermine/spermidine oxidase-like [Oratosquilla oratoria]|uniref:peroxisomal N(1)-acetyl-spermine/spermidine oxidase-like n=1 Tax=Oratosquilla oratoria TaxID=337810 RepID=UPI003F76BBFB
MNSCLSVAVLLFLGSLSPADLLVIPEPEQAHPCDNVPGNFQTWLSQANRETIVIVGGGVSGLNALKNFAEVGLDGVVLLEAQDRVGGRVKTTRTNGVITEDGAEWIHGEKMNVVYHVAQMLGQAVPEIQDEETDMRFESITGDYIDPSHYKPINDLWNETSSSYTVLVPYYDRPYGQFYVDRFPKAYGPGYDSKVGVSWLRFFENLVCDWEGTGSWMDVSAEDADHFEYFGDNYQWTNGYDAIVDYLVKYVPENEIHISTPVCKVYWDLAGTLKNASSTFGIPSGYEPRSEDAALVVTADGSSYVSRIVLMTASLGHLKERHEKLFIPRLPQSKIDVFNGMELGVANKVQIGFPERFWGPKPVKVNLFWTEYNLPEEMSWMYGCYGIFSVRGPSAVVQAFVTGERSIHMESLPEETVKQHMLYLMRKVFDEEVPEPNFFRRTEWHKNVWTRGSYESYVTMKGDNQGLHNHEPVKKPHKDSLGRTTLFFAGEHTNTIRFGTVDGAISSGVEQASNIMDELGL